MSLFLIIPHDSQFLIIPINLNIRRRNQQAAKSGGSLGIIGNNENDNDTQSFPFIPIIPIGPKI